MNENSQHNTENIEQAVRELAGIGRVWARHGLKVGQSALDASAQTLRATASALGHLSEQLHADAPAEPAPDADEITPVVVDVEALTDDAEAEPA